MNRIILLFIILMLSVLSSVCNGQEFYLDDLKRGSVFYLNYWRQGSSKVTEEMTPALNKLILGFEKYESLRVKINVHTNPQGDAKLNLKISKKRALTVKKYLVSQGVDRKKIMVDGYGGMYPLDPMSFINRRGEIEILQNFDLAEAKINREGLTYVKNTSSSDSVSAVITSGRKIALLIGNADYTNTSKLKNPINDVRQMSLTLRDLGFEVIEKINLNNTNLRLAIQNFASRLSSNDVIFFYFAGHGMQHNGINYILPTDVSLKNGSKDLNFEAISVELIFKILEYSNKESLNIIVLDACRNNPLNSGTRGNTGLSAVSPPSGTVIGFATSPGAVAYDGDGENGVYTQELIKQMNISQRIEDVFMNTRINVENITNDEQSPWELFRLRAVYKLK